MHIPVSQISEDGWTGALEIPLASLTRIVEAHGPQTGMLRVQVRLKNHRGCVDVRGRLVAELQLACGVCLDVGTLRVEAPLELMVAPQVLWKSGHREGQHEEVRVSAADLDVSFYDGDEIDLTAVLEDELLIAAPDSLSEQDEDGNCTTCHRRVEDVLAERQAAHRRDTEFHPFREAAERLREARTAAAAERMHRESSGSEAGGSAERGAGRAAERLRDAQTAQSRGPQTAQAHGANSSVRGADNTAGRERGRDKRARATRNKTGS